MKKLLAGLIALSFVLAGCGDKNKTAIETTVNSMMEAATSTKVEDHENLKNYFKDEGVLKDGDVLTQVTEDEDEEEDTTPKTTQATEDHMMECLSKTTYKIKNIKIADDKKTATVEMEVTYLDQSTALSNYFSKGITYAFGAAFSGATDDEMDEQYKKILDAEYEDVKDTTTKTITLDMVKDGDNWLIKEANEDIINVLTGNIYKVIKNLQESFNTDDSED